MSQTKMKELLLFLSADFPTIIFHFWNILQIKPLQFSLLSLFVSLCCCHLYSYSSQIYFIFIWKHILFLFLFSLIFYGWKYIFCSVYLIPLNGKAFASVVNTTPSIRNGVSSTPKGTMLPSKFPPPPEWPKNFLSKFALNLSFSLLFQIR